MTFDIIDYEKLLSRLEMSRPKPSHLLLGNGFNNSLGVRTSYQEIFNRMKKIYPGYRKLEAMAEKKKYDIELLTEDLKNAVQPDDRSFLAPYIGQNIKLDFMKATNEIVREKVKSVYSEHTESVYLLLRNFTSYFTLNFDPLLYLVLLRLKKENRVINAYAFHQQKLPGYQDLNEVQREIYEQVKGARQSGKLTMTFDKLVEDLGFSHETKGYFTDSAKRLFRQNKWARKDIEKACGQVWLEEKIRRYEANLKVNDGFSPEDDYLYSPEQNLFFLHGAFHIIKKGARVQKIMKSHNKAFLRRLEEAIHSESQKIISVFAGTTEDKTKEINSHSYLQQCLDELAKIEGTLVILGSSLADNDKHIFDCINQSNVKDIYISSSRSDAETKYQKALRLFPKKLITLFDRETIQYGPNS